MADLNNLSITGRLTHDATVKAVNGKNLLTFDVANNIGFGQYEKTNFYTVNMWGDRGLKLVQYLVKGTRVAVSGEESLNVWTGGDGVDHQSRVVTTFNVVLLGGDKKQNSSDAGATFSGGDRFGGDRFGGDRFGGDEAPVF